MPKRKQLLRMAAQMGESAPDTADDDGHWRLLVQRIQNGIAVPIISRSVRTDHIFAPDIDVEVEKEDEETRDTDDDGLGTETVDQLIASMWAEQLQFPLPARYNADLARVAQYNAVTSASDYDAKSKYLLFLKRTLLNWSALLYPDVADDVDELQHQVLELGFADLAYELDVPRFASENEDPLHVLARLPLPIYVTTSYYDFLERALAATGKTPRTQICFWSGEPNNVLPEHRTDNNFEPTVENPLVYHLHGLERYPRTIVLSIDDYLDFLVAVSQDADTTGSASIIPPYLRGRLAESSLLLLGYRLQDLDFSVLFRGVIRLTPSKLQVFNLALQLDPDEQEGFKDSETARSYLQEYFKPNAFKVEWDQTDSFVQRLWRRWNERRMG